MRIKDNSDLSKAAAIMGGIPYTFHRADGFYVLQFGSDDEAKDNGECNPGTLRVVNELTQDVVYEPKNA